MVMRTLFLPLASTVAVAVLLGGPWSSQAAAKDVITYSEDVYPIIQIRCLECHAPGQEGYDTSGLDLRTYDSLMKGTKHGPIVVPGDSMLSNLNRLVEGKAAPELRMPHGKKKLTNCEIDILRRWVNQGAENN